MAETASCSFRRSQKLERRPTPAGDDTAGQSTTDLAKKLQNPLLALGHPRLGKPFALAY